MVTTNMKFDGLELANEVLDRTEYLTNVPGANPEMGKESPRDSKPSYIYP
jgi:hypothetical protein